MPKSNYISSLLFGGLISAAVAVLALAGCDPFDTGTDKAGSKTGKATKTAPDKPEPWEAPPEDWEAPSTTLAAIDVPASSMDSADAWSSHARIVVTENAIVIETISAMQRLSTEQRRTASRRAEDADLDSIWLHRRIDLDDGSLPSEARSGAFLIPELETAVSDIVALSFDSDSPGPLRISVELDTDTTYSLTYSVGYTVWEQHGDAVLGLIGHSADDESVLLGSAVSGRSDLGECDPSIDPCAEPVVDVLESGLQVRTIAGIPESADGAASKAPCLDEQEPIREGALPRKTEDGSWMNRVILLDEALCPSVPAREDGTQDVAGLVELFNQIEAMAPGCRRSHWSTNTEQRWETLARLIGQTTSETAFDDVVLRRPVPKAASEADCEEGALPDTFDREER